MATNISGTAEAGHFRPTPIPEAKAFLWDELMAPTQQGLKQLFSWLDAASRKHVNEKDTGDEHLSTSLLISGARGSGKTTILLSARQALHAPEAFLGERLDEIDFKKNPTKYDLSRTLDYLSKRIKWLEPLDLEPVPSQSNLLATLLVRVRAALDESRHENAAQGTPSRWSATSILEESTEETWGDLDRLVRDASFMWEDIPATTDARTRAEQQIRASEIYANFRQRFSHAMEDVASKLSMPRFGISSSERVLLVLPIDNVDRSIEHLYSIVKLTRMVASPRLWFVLAAGHQEFQLFMERSFQKEFITAGQAGIGESGQAETLAIARRQAATTLRRALPPSYRINLELVKPHDAWKFHPNGVESDSRARSQDDKVKQEEREELGQLLKRLPLPTRMVAGAQVLASFDELFVLDARLDGNVKEAYRKALLEEGGDAKDRKAIKDKASLLTQAGRLALTLPPRTLQDLWHAARREIADMTSAGEWPTVGDGSAPAGSGATDDERLRRVENAEKTVRVATEMLRNAIDESDLPDWASEQLHNRVLRTDDRGNILMDLTGKPLSRSKRTSLSDVLEWPPGQGTGNGHGTGKSGSNAENRWLMTELHLRHFHEVVLVVNDLESPGRSVPLPPSVTGWLMLLHDVLMLFETPRVLSVDVKPFEMSPELVVTLHELWAGTAQMEHLVKLEFWWSPPTWNTFIEFDVLTAQWRAFLQNAPRGWGSLKPAAGGLHLSATEAASRHRFIQAAWVENICSVAGPKMGQWTWPEAGLMFQENASALEAQEQRVRDGLVQLVDMIRKNSRGYDRLWTARVWLENSLPLLVLPEFAPAPGLSTLLRWDSGSAKESSEVWSNLVSYWGTHGSRAKGTREQLVRSAVGRSSAAEALLQNLSKDQARAADTYYGWLDDVVGAWFGLVDQERTHLELDVLQGIAPLVSEHAEAGREH